MTYKVKFDTGETVSFENQPTDADIEEVVKKMGIKPKTAVIPEEPKQPDQKKSLFQKVGQGIGDVLTGIEKGAGSTAIGLGQVALKGASLIPGFKDTAEQAIQTGEDIKKQQFTPDNALQTVGKVGEQIGEMFIPVGAGPKVAAKLAEIPELAKNAPLIAKIIQGLTKTGAKAGAEGAEFAGKTYLQTGGDLGETTKAGVIATAINPLASGAGKLLEKVPETAWSAILKRTPTSVAKNPLLEKQIAKEGVVGLTKGQISQKFGREIQNLEIEIAEGLSGKQGVISTQAVAEKLNTLKTTYANIPGEESAISKIDEITQGILNKGENLSLQEANQLKRDIYGLISKSYGKGILEIPAKTEAQKLVARGLKEEIEKQVPEIAKLNNKQAVYIQAKKAIDQAIQRQTGKGIAGTGIGLYDILAGGVGQIASGLPGLAVGIGIKKTAESPFVLTNISKASQKLLQYFDELSPTQRVMFYNFLKSATIQTTRSDK